VQRYLLALVVTHSHDTIIEALEVHQLLSFLQLLVPLSSDLHRIAHSLGCLVPQPWNVHDGDHLHHAATEEKKKGGVKKKEKNTMPFGVN